ncbi:MAG: L,D-transpeptidase family protein, partial [Streptosporangiales bacterium]
MPGRESSVAESSPSATSVVARGMRHARPRARGLVPFILAGCVVLGACGSSSADEPAPSTPGTSSSVSSAAKQRKLSKATTAATIKAAPTDPAKEATKLTDGAVVHPRHRHTVYAKPGSDPVAILPTKELGNPTWVPVVERKDGWLRILLPSRPNGSTGWISKDKLKTAHTAWSVDIDVDARKLTLTQDGKDVGTWPVAVGKHKTPTPTGRTFLMASIIDEEQKQYTPIVLPLGAHSDTLNSFGGGPGTVAIHGWPDSSVFGHA